MTILYGGDYNPEQWPEETWQDDWDKLKLAKVNSATINVFSWALLEPQEGIFNFAKLDKIVQLLEKNQIKIVMATATAALPAWMTQQYPDVNRVDTFGRRQLAGKRHNACPNSPNFQRLASQLVTKIASRYAGVKNITQWHVSNEYGGYCYCDNCAKAFRVWLQDRYQNDLNKLNQEWNTNFWSHTYNSWAEINPPMKIGDSFSNGKPVLSALDLNYRRFQSDSLLNNFKMERDIIKRYDQRPVTTNLMGSQKDLDYFQWAQEMDLVSWDNYPSFDTPASFTAMQHDLMRGLKDKPFMLMEQTPNQQNWQPYNALKKPNQVKMLSYQALAHGAKTVQFFQLKQARNGCEKFHGAMLSHSNTTTTRTFKEVAELGEELSRLPEDLETATTPVEVGIVFDWNSYWGLENSLGPSVEMDYVQQVYDYYQAFYERKINIDMISQHSNFKKYKLVVVPSMYINSQAVTTELENYVHDGGTLIVSYMSGIADQNDNVFLGGYPGLLKNLLGIKIDETDALPPKTFNELVSDGTVVGRGKVLCDLIQPTTAKSLAHYGATAFYSDNSAMTVNQFGSGKAFYSGTKLDQQGMNYLLEQVLSESKINSDFSKTGVEITTRETKTDRYQFIINTDFQAKQIQNPYPNTTDLLTGKKLGKVIELDRFGTVILDLKK